MSRKQHAYRYKRKRVILIITVTLLIVGGTVVWILNVNTRSPWSSMLGIVCTALGLFLGFLQWYVQAFPEIACSTPISPTREIERWRLPQIGGVAEAATRNKGALIIYTRKQLRGTTINLSHGFDTEHSEACAATNVVERKIDDCTVFTGVFPLLEPGNYTVYTNTRQFLSKVTVSPGYITEIDWRYTYPRHQMHEAVIKISSR